MVSIATLSKTLRTTRVFLGNLLLAITSTALCALGILWALPHLRPTPRVLPDYDALLTYAPILPGGQIKPNVDLEVQGERAGQAVHWHTDANGFRIDHELTSQPPAGTQRIFFLGDSYVDGMRTDQRDTIGALLERDLKREGRSVEVVISGHNNPANAWYWLQNWSAQWHPDHVLLGITIGNDITHQNLNGGVVSGTAPGEVVLRDAALMNGDVSIWPELLPSGAYPPAQRFRDRWNEAEFGLRDWLAQRSTWFGQWVPPATEAISKPGKLYDRDVFAGTGLFFVPPTRVIANSYAANRTTLEGIKALLDGRGVALTVVLFPVRMQVSQRDWQLFARRNRIDAKQFDLRAPNQHILASCVMYQIDCVDPTEAMAQHDAAGGAELYRPRGDMHLNEAGNALIAAMVAQHLMKQPIHITRKLPDDAQP